MRARRANYRRTNDIYSNIICYDDIEIERKLYSIHQRPTIMKLYTYKV